MTALRCFRLAVHISLFVSVSSMDIYTPKEIQAQNGTDTRLKCTFSSSSSLSDDLSVSWTFRPLSGGNGKTVFTYHKGPLSPEDGHFGGRIIWDGDVNRGDVSIIIRNIQPKDNGTYLCQVLNKPDVHGEVGEITVEVVDKVKFSEMLVLLLVIGLGSLLIILLVLSVVLYRYCRKQRTHSTAVSVLECTEKLNEKPQDLMDANA
ncbi:myelin protein zero-like protein 2 [Pseudophryne corroboree]|uniref:myelin protein zero-like protein 2 n=1 Tax=Pseudophryne corroboree TaxID=495146 RepID=UPI0030814F66